MTTGYDWTGRVGDVWAEEWRRTDRALDGIGRHLDNAIAAVAPPRRFRTLDIGAGAGATSLALAAARPEAEVIGGDLSAALAATARSRADAAGLANARFVVGDALATATSVAPVDLFVSRHGVMFFDDPVAAFAVLARAAAPGGAIVFSCFAARRENDWANLIAPVPPGDDGAPGPFAFADPDRVAALLAAAGWHDAEPTRVEAPYRVGEGKDPVADAIGFLSRIGPAASALRDAALGDRPAIEARLRDRLAAARNGDVIDFRAAAWIWRARAGEQP